MTDLDLIYPTKKPKGTFTRLMALKRKEKNDLRSRIKQTIWEYRRIASKNRKGDWEEGRYEGIKELGSTIREILK